MSCPVASEVAPKPGIIGVHPHCPAGFLVEDFYHADVGKFRFPLVVSPDRDDVMLAACNAQGLVKVFIDEVGNDEVATRSKGAWSYSVPSGA